MRFCFSLLFSTIGNFWVNAKDLQALTLVRPTRENRLLDPLTVEHLDNWLKWGSKIPPFKNGLIWKLDILKVRFWMVDHSKTGPFGTWSTINHQKSGHARISDPHCFSDVPLPLSEECRWTCRGLQRRCCRWRRAPKICNDRSAEICRINKMFLTIAPEETCRMINLVHFQMVGRI